MLDAKASKYFDSVEATYERNRFSDSNVRCPTPCDAEIMGSMLEATMDLRSPDVDATVISVKKSAGAFGDYSDVVNFVHQQIAQIPEEGHIRTQIIVDDMSHFYVIDLKLSQDQKECILLDAAGDQRATMAMMRLTRDIEFDNFYMSLPDKRDNSVITENQKDFHSCPFYALHQAAELSQIDIYEHLDTLQIPDASGLKNCTWDNMPPQLSVYAQRSADTMQQAQERFAEQGAEAREAGYISAEAFGERYRENITEVKGKQVNSGITHFARQVMTKTMDLLNSKQATADISQTQVEKPKQQPPQETLRAREPPRQQNIEKQKISKFKALKSKFKSIRKKSAEKHQPQQEKTETHEKTPTLK